MFWCTSLFRSDLSQPSQGWTSNSFYSARGTALFGPLRSPSSSRMCISTSRRASRTRPDGKFWTFVTHMYRLYRYQYKYTDHIVCCHTCRYTELLYVFWCNTCISLASMMSNTSQDLARPFTDQERMGSSTQELHLAFRYLGGNFKMSWIKEGIFMFHKPITLHGFWTNWVEAWSKGSISDLHSCSRWSILHSQAQSLSGYQIFWHFVDNLSKTIKNPSNHWQMLNL